MSLFSRPAWAKAQPSSSDANDNIFSHSDRSYRDIVAEQERRKKEKLERKKAKEERRNSGKRAIKDEPVLSESIKKRRITSEDGKALLQSIGMSPSQQDDYSPVLIDDGMPIRRSPRHARHINIASPRKQPPRTQVVDLEGDDDEENNEEETIVYDEPALIPTPPVDSADDSDEDIAELARRARQKAQRKGLDQKSRTPDIASHSPYLSSTAAGRQTTPPPDPPVEILVTSRLPGTNPLIVHRKLSQNLQAIRKAWCGKQNFSEAFSNQVFLVHRMRKLFDLTTCRSLGLYVDSFGTIVMKGAEGKEGVEKVHLEAVTEEILKEMKAEKEQELRRRSDELALDDQTDAGAQEEAGAATQQQQVSNIKLIMRARKRADFNVLVKPTTTFSKIAAAYCTKHGIDSAKHTIFLEFDGERLNPEDEVQTTDLSDMDVVEVHIS